MVRTSLCSGLRAGICPSCNAAFWIGLCRGCPNAEYEESVV